MLHRHLQDIAVKQREGGLPPRPSNTTHTIKRACFVTHRSIPTQSATVGILTVQEQARVTGFVPTEACNESTLGKGLCGVQQPRKVRRPKTTQKQYIYSTHCRERNLQVHNPQAQQSANSRDHCPYQSHAWSWAHRRNTQPQSTRQRRRGKHAPNASVSMDPNTVPRCQPLTSSSSCGRTCR